MPIEIRELLIKVSVGNDRPQQPALDDEEIKRIKRDITNECVRKVMQELQKRKER
ncbi:hypothetical protein BH09BAC1_BH09BAC1_21590 [soil metagenome]